MEPQEVAAGMNVKPFTPEEANNIVMSLKRPAVFCNMVFDWPVQHWNANYLSEKLKGKKIRFRIGKKNADTDIQFETHCSYVEATLEQFLVWNCRKYVFPSPFAPYDSCKYWAYADYKYMAMLFDNNTDLFQDVVWADFGFPERNGRDSTLWIGTLGANTPCHVDSYGCNLVVQVQGRKRWHLFPPEDTSFLYPTRIPYEESSIFSKVNVVNPDWKRFPQFRKARAHVVTLHPGEVLFVPRHWWHYVESIDPITVSVNSWIELDEDHESRVEEAITRMLVCAVKSAQDPGNTEVWLNPTEAEATSHKINLQFLNQAVAACLENRGKEDVKDTLHSASKDCSLTASFKKRKSDESDYAGDCRSLQGEPDCSTKELKHLQKMPPGLNLVPVVPHKEAASLHEESNRNYEGSLCGLEGGPVKTLQGTGKQSVINAIDKVLADQTVLDWDSNHSQTTISTNEILDCMVNPRVVSLMARLLLERQHS